MKKMIVTILLQTAVLLGMAGLTGCSYTKTYGLAAPGLTSEQIQRRHLRAIQTDRWQIQDDIDALFLLERSGRRHRLIHR